MVNNDYLWGVDVTDGGNLKADLQILKAEIQYIRSDVNKLLKVIMEGNGSSLVSKMAVMESRHRAMEDDFKKNEQNESNMKMAVIAAALSLITSLVVIVIQFKLGAH